MKVFAIRPGVALALSSLLAIASSAIGEEKPKLQAQYRLQEIATGVTTTPEGRVFVLFPHLDGGAGLRIAELSKEGTPTAYPDKDWNSWEKGKDPTTAFLGVNSLRMGPQGMLWVVDTGTRGFGSAVVPGGAKLVAIDVTKHQVHRVYPLAAGIQAGSYIDDVRFHGKNAYLTDAGKPGLLILDLESGSIRRVLDNHPSTIDQRDIHASGRIMMADGKPIRIHADQLEVSPDGVWLYYQPASGPMYRVETKYLNDLSLAPSEVAKHVALWVDTPSTGGTAMDGKGNLYLSDVNNRRILQIDPSGKTKIVIEDSRLDWVDAMWIDQKGRLWLPAAQLDQLAQFQGGVSKVKLPIVLYTLAVKATPEN